MAVAGEALLASRTADLCDVRKEGREAGAVLRSLRAEIPAGCHASTRGQVLSMLHIYRRDAGSYATAAPAERTKVLRALRIGALRGSVHAADRG